MEWQTVPLDLTLSNLKSLHQRSLFKPLYMYLRKKLDYRLISQFESYLLLNICYRNRK